MEYEILQSILNIDDVTNECVCMVSESYASLINKDTFIYTESSSPSKSFGQKIIDGLKKILSFIVNGIKTLIEKIKSIFSKHKNGTVNDIAASVVGNTVTSEYFVQEGKQQGVDYITAHGKKPEDFGKELFVSLLKNGKIHVEFGTSDDPVDKCPFFNKSDTRDTENLNINMNGYNAGVSTEIVKTIMKIDLLRDMMNKLFSFIDAYKSTNVDHNTIDKMFNDAKKAYDEFKDSFNDIDIWSINNFDFSVSEMVEIQQLYSKLSAEVDKLLSSSERSEEQYIKFFARLSRDLVRTQMSLNTFTNKFTFDANYISPQYRNKIKNPEMLGRFVRSCVDNGVPPKYIAYNSWLISNKTLRGDNKNYRPIRGQSRIVLFPEDPSVVYKIAMSGFGIASNNNETHVTNIVKHKPEIKKYFALILDNYSDGAVVKQERSVNHLKFKSDDHDIIHMRNQSINELSNRGLPTNAVKDQLDIIQRELNLKHPIDLQDLHAANVSLDTNRGNIVLYDYGMFDPIMKNSETHPAFSLSDKMFDKYKNREEVYRKYKEGEASEEEFNKVRDEYTKEIQKVENKTPVQIKRKLRNYIDELEDWKEDSPEYKNLKEKIAKYEKEIERRKSLGEWEE